MKLLFPGSQSPSGTQIQAQAHFHYHDINVVSFDGLTPHLKLSASLPLFQVRFKISTVTSSFSSGFGILDFPVLVESTIEACYPASDQSCDQGID